MIIVKQQETHKKPQLSLPAACVSDKTDDADSADGAGGTNDTDGNTDNANRTNNHIDNVVRVMILTKFDY